MKNNLAILAAVLALGGCATTSQPEPPIVQNRPISVPDVKPAPMQFKHIAWKVYTLDQLAAMVAQAKASGNTATIYYVLDQDNYDILAYNLSEMDRYILDMKAVNQYLVKAIEINNAGGDPNDPKTNPVPSLTPPSRPAPLPTRAAKLPK